MKSYLYGSLLTVALACGLGYTALAGNLETSGKKHRAKTIPPKKKTTRLTRTKAKQIIQTKFMTPLQKMADRRARYSRVRRYPTRYHFVLEKPTKKVKNIAFQVHATFRYYRTRGKGRTYLYGKGYVDAKGEIFFRFKRRKKYLPIKSLFQWAKRS